MPYLTIQEIEMIADRIVHEYCRYRTQYGQTVTRIEPQVVTRDVLGHQSLSW